MKGFKTVAYGLLLALGSILASPEVSEHVGSHLGWYGSLAGTLVVVLRALTSSPIFKKPE